MFSDWWVKHDKTEFGYEIKTELLKYVLTELSINLINDLKE